MPRGRVCKPPVLDLEAYPYDLTVWQVCDYLNRNVGLCVDPRRLHRLLHTGYVYGYHQTDVDREWLIPKHSVRLLVRRLTRTAA